MTSILFNKIFGDLIPQGTNTNQKNIMINCIFHNDKNASLSISTDENKPVYNCFGCNEKGSWIGFYMKRNNLSYPEALKALDMDKPFEQKPVKQFTPKEPPPKIEIDYSDFCLKAWNDTIAHDEFYEFYCKKLYDLRGLTLPTAAVCMIGYDPKQGWIFPCIRYSDNKIVGYEVRQKYFQTFKFKNGKETKCYKAENTPSCICTVFQGFNNKKAIFCEGFIDAYFMYQFQNEKFEKYKYYNRKDFPTILTASCGVSHIPELVKEAKLWNDFEEIIFCLDNDEWLPNEKGVLRSAGNEAKQKLMELPHENKFKFFNGLAEGEDFEDYYKRVLIKEIYK